MIDRIHPFLFFAALCVGAAPMVAPSPAYAGDDAKPGGSFLFQWDNDKVVDTDRHYTNGMRIAYTLGEASGQWLETGQAFAGRTFFADPGRLRVGWTLGQDMYTPENVDTYVPNPLDRPYAGWSYAGFTVQSEPAQPESAFTLTRLQDTFELDIGMIGPSSRAAQTQNAFHRLINVSVSHGWRSQIANEPGLLATRTAKWRTQNLDTGLWDGWTGTGLKSDAVLHATGQLGNVRTGAALGMTARLGENLQDDAGPVYGAFALPHKSVKSLSYAFFVGGEARAVVRDIFLDGNTFRKSPDVKKNPAILEGRAGVQVHIPVPDGYGVSAANMALSVVHRTREFKTQDRADRYGSLQVTVNF